MSSKKVLVITYYWPPAAGPGVQRFLKFCKYLPEFGWDPVVLTVESGSYPSSDTSLGKELSDTLPIYKSKTFEPFSIYNKLRGVKGNTVPVSLMGIKEDKRLIQRISLYIRANFFIPDARKGWKPHAVKAVRRILKEHDISAIITTGPPQSTHLIGLELKKQYGLPWIADFRDPWTSVFYNKFFPRTAATERKDKAMETSVLAGADAVVAVSSGLKEEFEDRSKTLEVIYNGFDHEDIPNRDVRKTEKFSLEYIGNLKPNQHPKHLWAALKELIEEVGDFKELFSLNLTGNIDPYIKQDLEEKFELGAILNIISYVSHNEAVERMIDTNLLLFIIPEAENNKLIITGKLFEYLAVRTPILSIGPVEGDASKLLQEANRDEMISYDEKDKIKSQILKRYMAWLDGGKIQEKHPEADLMQYSRKDLSRKLGNLLDSIVS